MNTRHIWQGVALIYLLTLACETTLAQQPLNYWQKPETMIQDQASIIFEQVHKILDSHPPSTTANKERQLALFSIDALLHDNRLDNGTAFRDYIEKRYQNVVEKLGKEKPKTNETRIYRLYNHGFIVQTPSVTIGLDIIRGGQAANPFVSESLIRSVVDECDILFLSHAHADHTDKSVVQLFVDQQKDVIAPPGLLENLSPRIKYLRGNDVIKEQIQIPSKQQTLIVKVFPGHQAPMLNNVYAITTPEGITVMHTGDQDGPDRAPWITHIGDEVKTDVFLVHAWMSEIEQTVESVKPAIIITGHENEMEHSIDHRESYWLTFRRFKNIKTLYIVMAWGEYYTISQ